MAKSKQPITYAIVGLGRAGWNIHVKALRGRKGAQIVAVADPVAERRDEAASEFGCQCYGSIDEMLKAPGFDADVVVIATPSVCHGPDTIKALKAGRHVVVEKPMSTSLREADRMIRAAKDARRKLFVHQNYRFFPEFTYYQSVIKSGRLGKVYHMRNALYGSFARRNDWQTLSRNAGGVLNNTCPHFIDQALQLTGSPIEKVFGDLKQIGSAGDVEDHVKIMMRAENGCTVDLEISSAQAMPIKPPKWTICGTHGTLTSDGAEATVRWFDPRQAPAIKAQDGPANDRKYGNTDELPWQEVTEPAVGPDIGDFYDNVFAVLRERKKMVVTPESVREVMRVITESRKGTVFNGKPAREGSRRWKGKRPAGPAKRTAKKK